MQKKATLIVFAIFSAVFALSMSQTICAQQSPIIGITHDNHVQIQIYSFTTSPTIQYYPYDPSHSSYIWACLDIEFTNIGSTGTVDTNALFASLKDSQNYVYEGRPVANDPQDIKLLDLAPGSSQRGNLYFEIPANSNIISFTWDDYTSTILLPASSPTPSPTPSPTVMFTSQPTPTHTTPTIQTVNPTITQTQGYQTVTTFTGASDQTTNYFTIPSGEWLISWRYAPDESYPQYALFSIFAYPRGEAALYATSLIKTGADETNGVTYVHEGQKDYYLKIGTANIQSYTIQIEAQQATPTPIVPEFSWLAILPLLVSTLAVFLFLKKRQVKKT